MTLHARIDGVTDGPPLVLLNSVGSTTGMWSPLVGSLGEEFRVIRIDHRGHGASPPSPSHAPAELAQLAGEVVAALDALGLARVHIAGLSLGGMVGMWLAIHRPERVGRLALLCTSAHLPPAQYWLDRAVAVRKDGMASIAAAVVDRWLTGGLAERDPALVTSLRAMVSGIDAESYAQCCSAIAAMDLRADLSRIASSTLVLAGAQDPATPPEHAELIANRVPSARLVVLDDAAHLATVEQPERIAALLREHFRGGATLARGYATRRAVLGDAHVDRTIAATTSTTTAFQELLTRYAWGDVWSRPELTRRERSMVTLAALTTLGAEHELEMHVHAAVRNGLTHEDIVEVLMHVAVYAGMPRANRAIAIAVQAFAEEPAD